MAKSTTLPYNPTVARAISVAATKQANAIRAQFQLQMVDIVNGIEETEGRLDKMTRPVLVMHSSGSGPRLFAIVAASATLRSLEKHSTLENQKIFPFADPSKEFCILGKHVAAEDIDTFENEHQYLTLKGLTEKLQEHIKENKTAGSFMWYKNKPVIGLAEAMGCVVLITSGKSRLISDEAETEEKETA